MRDKAIPKEVVNSQKLIKIDFSNERIKRFNYGIKESRNKPSPIVLTKQSNLIGQRAAQTRRIITYLPLIISYIIVEAQSKSSPLSDKWEVILLLLQVTQIAFSPIVTTAMLAEFKELIVAHHSLS